VADVGGNSPKDGMATGASSRAINLNEAMASSGNKSSKRAKKDHNADGMVQAIDRCTQTLATLSDAITMPAIVRAGKKALLEGLFEEVDNLPCFELEHKSKYYAHLVANPDIATTFMILPLLYKITWVITFVNEKC
jgi:hypothetical protein